MATETDELKEGVLRGDACALRELLVRLRPHCIQKLFDRFAHVSGMQAEILNDAESLLFEWSLGPKARDLLPKGEALGTLAFRLVSQVVRQYVREEDRQARLSGAVATSADFAVEVEPPTGLGTAALLAVIAALPETYRDVLEAEVRFQHGKGPALAEVISVSPGAARVRLSRARAVLARALREKKLSELIDMETTDG